MTTKQALSLPELSLPEEVLLLALRDEEGTIEMGSNYPFAIGGAVLAELVMRGRVRLEGSRKRTIVGLVSDEPMGKPFLDDCLGRIAEAKRRASAQTWVTRFAQAKRLKHRLAAQLCDAGILRAAEGKVMLLFTRRIYPEVDAGPEGELVERMRQAIFSDDDRLDPRTAVIVALADKAGLLAHAFGRKQLRARKARLEQIANGDATVQATKEAIEAMQAAVLIACIVPAIASTAAH